MTIYNWSEFKNMAPPAKALYLDGVEHTFVRWADTNTCHIERCVTEVLKTTGKEVVVLNKANTEILHETLAGTTLRIEFNDGKVVTVDNRTIGQKTPMPTPFPQAGEMPPEPKPVSIPERTGRRIILD